MKAPDLQMLRCFSSLGILCLCSTLAFTQNTNPPASGYLEASLRTGVQAGYTKIGEAFQATALSWWSIPDCTLPQGARIYGKVVSSVRHTRSSPESTLGLLIENADCQDHPHAPLSLHILEIVALDAAVPLHTILPVGSGGMAAASGVIAHDDNTKPDQESSSIRIGAVVGEIPMRLGIAEGPHFAEVLHSGKRTVSLLTGTILVIGTADMIPADQQLHLHAEEKQP